MQSVGQQIREQRLRLGLKLEEISARSRISLKTLQAIESDDLAAISSAFLYKSFARQFVEHLKLDYATLAPSIDAAALSMPSPRIPGEGDLGRTKVAPLPLRGRKRSFRWLYSVASLGFMLVACSSLYGLWQSSKSTWVAQLAGLLHSVNASNVVKSPVAAAAPASVRSRRPSAAVPATRPVLRPSPHVVRPLPQDDNLAAADPDPAPSGVPPALSSNNPSPADGDSPEFRVELSAIERTWLSIVEDGKQTFSGVLDPAETKILEGHDTARIRTGNAGGINCVFNGKSIGPLGPRGQVRTVVFTKNNYEVLETPAHIALTHYPSIVE